MSPLASKLVKIVIIIDGLDLLTPEYGAISLQWLSWTRDVPPARVRVLISCAEKGEIMKVLRRWSPEPRYFVMGPLEALERSLLVRHRLALYRKKLDESAFSNEMRMLTAKRDGGSPLYLVLACNELRVFGDFDGMPAKLKEIAGSVPDLVNEVLSRVEDEIGLPIVRRALSIICISRDGVLESEMLRMLRRKGEESLPLANWTALFAAIKSLLRIVESADAKLQLVHVEAIAAIRARYLPNANAVTRCHRLVARFFQSQIDLKGFRRPSEQEQRPINLRAVSEVVYHLLQAGELEEAATLLQDVVYVWLRCFGGQVHALLHDYTQLLSIRRVDKLGIEGVRAMHVIVSSSLHVLVKYPIQFLQLVLNEGSPALKQSALDVLQQGRFAYAWLEHLSADRDAEANAMVLAQGDEAIVCLASSSSAEVVAAGFYDVRFIFLWCSLPLLTPFLNSVQ